MHGATLSYSPSHNLYSILQVVLLYRLLYKLEICVQLGHGILSSSILIMNIFKTGQCMGQLWPTRQTGHETHCTCKSDDRDYVQGCVNISVSEGETELEPGGNPLDWKAVARLHPCIVKRLRTMVCGREFSTNLGQRGEEIKKNENLLELFSVHMPQRWLCYLLVAIL